MNEVSRKLSTAIKNLDNGILEALEKSCQALENTAKRESPYDDGILRASMQHHVERNKGVVGTNVEYAPYVHEGTGIYATDGNGRKEVPWTYRSADGSFHTTKGQKPNPFLKRAVDMERKNIMDQFKGIKLG